MDKQEPTDVVIAIDNVTKHYGNIIALDSVTINVHKGRIHGFLGPNGAGKTTAIKVLMDFIRPSHGTVTIFGSDAHVDSTVIKGRVGYLSGDIELYDNLTGNQYLKYIAHLRGNDDYTHLKKLCTSLEITLNRKIGTLSRGNKQKIGLAAALMDDPDLLILDEPTTGLDPLMQQKFNDVVRDYARRGKTVFMSSHILSEVQEICDVITFMRKGKVVQTIDISEILSKNKKHIILTHSPHSPILPPPAAIGALNLKQTKTHTSFDVDTADRKLVRWIAMQPISDVTIAEASLDNIFMDLYEEGNA